MAEIATITLNPAIDLYATVEELAPFRKLRCADPRRDAGGGGINVARVLRRWNCDALAIFPADGATGALLCQLLARDGVRNWVIDADGETREDVTVFERCSKKEYRFVLPGPEMSKATWQSCLRVIEALSPPPKFLVASGSLPPGAPLDAYAEIGQLAKRIGSQFVLDTSGAPLAKALEAGVYLVKPNRRELSEWAARSLASEGDWLAACRELTPDKAQLIALTLGDQGALLVSADGAWRALAPKIDAVSTVGAGDSFLAGLIWRLSLGDALASSLAFAVAAGTAALMAPGTELARPDDVERLRRQVTVTELR